MKVREFKFLPQFKKIKAVADVSFELRISRNQNQKKTGMINLTTRSPGSSNMISRSKSGQL